LNGKIRIKLESKGAYVYVYMMPNRFNTKLSNTVGILENNMIKENLQYSSKSNMIEVPTDWTIYIQYNIGYLDGYMKVTSEAMEYSAEDADHITNDWAPTGTYFLSQE
jgi:hypothetical protein